jgi:Lipocalin-like domain
MSASVSNFAQTPDEQRRNRNINRYAIAKRSVFISTCCTVDTRILHVRAMSHGSRTFQITEEETTMDRRHILGLSMITAMGLALLPGSALAQQKSLKEQLTGTWTIVSTDQTAPDGKKHQLFGPNPKGTLVLDPSGQFVQIIVRPGRDKFRANSRLEGTPEENKAAVLGTTATFGTWSVDEGSKTLIVRIEGGMYPNQEGVESKRSVSVTGDELKITNPATASGMRADNVWKRAKAAAMN